MKKINVLSLTSLILVFGGCDAMSEDSMNNTEEIKWVDALDYVDYLDDVGATSKERQEYIRGVYGISEEAVDKYRKRFDSEPRKQLFGSLYAMQYLKEKGLYLRPWKLLFSSSPSHTLCNQTDKFLNEASWSKKVEPKQVAALIQSAYLCQGLFQKEINRLEKRNREGCRDDAIRVRKDQLESKQELIEKVQTKFGTDISSNSPYDLPGNVREAYEHYQDNQKARQALKASVTREVCSEVNASLKEAFYKLRLANVHNIHTGEDKSKSNITRVTDLLSAVCACEEIDSIDS